MFSFVVSSDEPFDHHHVSLSLQFKICPKQTNHKYSHTSQLLWDVLMTLKRVIWLFVATYLRRIGRSKLIFRFFSKARWLNL